MKVGFVFNSFYSKSEYLLKMRIWKNVGILLHKIETGNAPLATTRAQINKYAFSKDNTARFLK